MGCELDGFRGRRLHTFGAAVWAIALGLSCGGSMCDTQGRTRKSGGSSPPVSDGANYDVKYVPGGIDRVILSKRDDARNLCVQVTLTSPSALAPPPPGKVKLPANWELGGATAVRDASACRGTMRPRPRPAGGVEATEVSGSVRWGASPTEATDVDLRLTFPASGGQPGFTERMRFKR